MSRRKQAETKQVNARLPLGTVAQLDALIAQQGGTVTQILITAIDRMATQELSGRPRTRPADAAPSV